MSSDDICVLRTSYLEGLILILTEGMRWSSHRHHIYRCADSAGTALSRAWQHGSVLRSLEGSQRECLG